MKNLLKYIFFFFLSAATGLLHPAPLHASNLRISNLTLEDRGVSDWSSSNYYAIAQFDISWDNSWRNETNYDGAWVFFKIYNTATSSFVDANLDYAGDSIVTIKKIDPPRTSAGTSGNLQIEIPVDPGRDAEGAFLYRKSTGNGTIQSSKVRIPVFISSAYQAVDIILYAYAIEMVYIPEAAFYAGDTTSTGAFKQGSSDTDPWYLDSDSTLRTANSTTNSFYYTDSAGGGDEFATGDVFTIPVTYPLGYNAFWVMKYEITEGQFVDFFNTLGSNAKTTLDITSASGKNSTSVVFRNTFTTDGGSPPTASTSRTDRAMSYLSWTDLSAYLDWAKLRPMTEFEYEKIARGPLSPVAGEYAWGSTTINRAATFSTSPEDGTETFTDTNANANYNMSTFSRGDDFIASGSAYVRGPVRVGIFATNGSSRSAAGAGYYGVMELTGNVDERVVGVANTTVLWYWPVNGDGSPDSNGYADELGWVGLEWPNGWAGVTQTPDGVGRKGGGWNETTANDMRVSDRAQTMLGDGSRTSYYGGRGVRGYDTPNPLLNCGDGSDQMPEQCDDGFDSDCINCKCPYDDTTTCWNGIGGG